MRFKPLTWSQFKRRTQTAPNCQLQTKLAVRIRILRNNNNALLSPSQPVSQLAQFRWASRTVARDGWFARSARTSGGNFYYLYRLTAGYLSALLHMLECTTRPASSTPGSPYRYPHPIHWKGRQHCFSSQLSAPGRYLLSWLVFVVQLAMAYGPGTGSQEVISIGGTGGSIHYCWLCLQF